MTTPVSGQRVLVAEDEDFIAKGLADDLEDIGADVLGPVATVADALASIAVERLDAAVLDVNLARRDGLPRRGRPSRTRGAFRSGHRLWARCAPTRYAGVPRFEKVVEVDQLVAKLFGGPT